MVQLVFNFHSAVHLTFNEAVLSVCCLPILDIDERTKRIIFLMAVLRKFRSINSHEMCALRSMSFLFQRLTTQAPQNFVLH